MRKMECEPATTAEMTYYKEITRFSMDLHWVNQHQERTDHRIIVVIG